MAHTVDEGFQEFLKRLVPTVGERSSGTKHRESVKSALENNLEVLNFFESGSFSHGTGVRKYSDIDAFVSLNYSAPASSYTSLNWIKNVLTSRYPYTAVEIRRPAVVVKFGGGYENWEIIPAFVTGDHGKHLTYKIPGPSIESNWITSAPKAHLQFVNDYNKKPHKGSSKSLARLIKAWKYYNNVPISSFYLEMRCAQYVGTLDSYIEVWDVCLILEKLNNHSLSPMNDPTGASSRFHACSSEFTRNDALSKLNTASIRARKALEAHKAKRVDLAFYYLNLLFGGYFPAR